jgi:hypothetical protein
MSQFKRKKNPKNIIKKSIPLSEFPQWIDLEIDIKQCQPPPNMPSPEEVIYFLEHMPIIQNHEFALKIADKLKRILFFYQKSDTISRFERGKLMKEREKNSKKIKEWDKLSNKLERKINQGMEHISKQEKEIQKLKDGIKKTVKENLAYEGLLTIDELINGKV